jgi:hypothetical protein
MHRMVFNLFVFSAFGAFISLIFIWSILLASVAAHRNAPALAYNEFPYFRSTHQQRSTRAAKPEVVTLSGSDKSGCLRCIQLAKEVRRTGDRASLQLSIHSSIEASIQSSIQHPRDTDYVGHS